MDGVDARLIERARRGAAWVREQGEAGRKVTVVHHIDADGVSSAAIALTTLERAGVAARPLAVKSLDQAHLELIHAEAPEALWFCDLGSTAYMHFARTPRLVCDHHELVRDGHEETFAHVNPLLDGLPGDTLSGAGCAFLVAHAVDPANADLLPMALVGAAADLQDRRGGFTGANGAMLSHGLRLGLLEAEQDLAWFGPETRPIRKYLGLARDPVLPGIDARGAERLARDCGVELSAPGGEATWSSLDPAARLRLRSAVVRHLLDTGTPAAEVDRALRTVVRIRAEPPGPTRELQEFGTLLNSTARYGRPEVGLALARGARGPVLEEALGLLGDHRRHLAGSLDAFAAAELRVLGAVQWLDVRDQVRDTVVGIVAGMALEGLALRRDLVLLAFAWTPDGRSKASARAPAPLQGLVDLSVAMREAAAALGGQGGGHRGAAGATLPRGREAEFARLVDRLLVGQRQAAEAAVAATA